MGKFIAFVVLASVLGALLYATVLKLWRKHKKNLEEVAIVVVGVTYALFSPLVYGFISFILFFAIVYIVGYVTGLGFSTTINVIGDWFSATMTVIDDFVPFSEVATWIRAHDVLWPMIVIGGSAIVTMIIFLLVGTIVITVLDIFRTRR